MKNYIDKLFFRQINVFEFNRLRLLFCVGLYVSFVYAFFDTDVKAIMGVYQEHSNSTIFTLVLLFLCILVQLCLALGAGEKSNYLFLLVACAAGIFNQKIIHALDPIAIITGNIRTRALAMQVLIVICAGAYAFRKLEKEKVPIWPITLIKITIYAAFFSAGISKLYFSSHWYNGLSISAYLLENNYHDQNSFGYFLASSPNLLKIICTGVLLLEILAPIVLFFPILEMPFLVGAMIFHFLATHLMDLHDFFNFYSLGYLVFLSEARTEFVKRCLENWPHKYFTIVIENLLPWFSLRVVLIILTLVQILYVFNLKEFALFH